MAGAGIAPDAVVLCPAFFEAGRFTADGIHWVHLGGELIPACDTEFARDATFGFTELTLADWARARGAPPDVIDVGLATLARGDEDAVVAALRAARGGQAVVLNATNYGHLATFDAAARRAEAAGTTIVYRTGPSYVRAAAGLGRAELEAANDRLAHVLDKQLAQSKFVSCNEYTIADMAIFPWMRNAESRGIDMSQYPNAKRWFDAINIRPAVVRALKTLADESNSNPVDDKAREVMFGKTQFQKR